MERAEVWLSVGTIVYVGALVRIGRIERDRPRLCRQNLTPVVCSERALLVADRSLAQP